MAKEREIFFPLGGQDANWAHSKQPLQTTPSAQNVRPYSADQERARGGIRPGLKRAYTAQVGGTTSPIQWMGWLDWGFGDTVLYTDNFDSYSGEACLDDETNWTSDGPVRRTNGYVHLAGATTSQAADYAGFAGDTWNDFDLYATLKWKYGTTGAVGFHVSYNDKIGTHGAIATVAVTGTEIASPGSGFQTKLQLSLNGGAVYTAHYGMMFGVTGGDLHVEARGPTVKLFWNGIERGSATRTQTDACDAAGFAMTLTDPSISWYPMSHMDIQVHDWHLTTMTTPVATARELVMIGNRLVYGEIAEGTGPTVKDSDQLADVALYSAAHLDGNLFIVGGTTPKVYRPMESDPSKVLPWTARKGAIVSTCTGIVNWRNRVVLFGAKVDPQNYYMSRVGDPFDFDYGQEDAEAAVAGNLSVAGRIGDPIQAACPLSDDVLVFGCSRSIWVMHGDPKAGGRAIRLTDQTGILGQNAWTTDLQGNLYFFGEEGLFKMSAHSAPVNLTSSRLPSLSGYKHVKPGTGGTAGEHYISMSYDADRHGVLLFLTPYGAATAGTHYFYDLRTNSFWPEKYPKALGPTTVAYYNASGASYRKLLLGGHDGYVYEFDEDVKGDVTGATAAIDSYVWTRPQRLSNSLRRDAVIALIQGTTSATGDTVNYDIYTADNVEGVTGGTSICSGVWGPGRNIPNRTRVRGGAHAVKVSGKTVGRRWGIENIAVEVNDGGPQR